jgi:hypothetical protein
MSMAISLKQERSLVSHDEYGAIEKSHHPEIYALSLSEMQELQTRLRGMRDKERTLTRQMQRERRGKAEPRGGSFPGTADQPMKRKQVFSSALKRLNKEIERLRNLEARAANVDAARRALALRRAVNLANYPAAGDTSNEGMKSLPNRRRLTRISRKRIGSVSQATKAAQARRDSR